MKKILLLGLVLAGLIIAVVLNLPSQNQGKKIGIVVPIEHQAMQDMTEGFLETIHRHYGSEVAVEIQNAQGDGNIQKAIIENFKRKQFDLIVPIGTDVTLMTQNSIKTQPIIGLDVTSMVTQDQSNVTGILESPIEPSYHFIKKLLPQAKKIAMVYSASDKNYEMVQIFTREAQKDSVAVQPIMIQTLPDLYVLAHTVAPDADAIFIAKDHLVASGAPSLARTAIQLGIPLITSDEGSVIAGGAVAMGNRELDIGRAGGAIAIQLLEGADPHAIPIQPLNVYTVFINAEMIEKQGLQRASIQQTAQALGYKVKIVDEAS